MKIAFFGTPIFAADILSGILHFKNISVELVVSQPDKPVGRKQELFSTPVKQLALENHIRILQPERLKNNPFFIEELQKLKLDFIVVVAYGKIIPKEILSIPRYGCINIHGSILPEYRGASPVQSAVKNGDQETGLTIMYMDEKMDEGDIVQIKKVPIKPDDTSLHIFEKFTEIGPQLLRESLEKIMSGEISGSPQDHSQATYCHMIEKEEGKIDFTKLSAQEIYNRYRAFQPWPGVYTVINGKKLTLEKISLGESRHEKPGTFVKLDKKTFGMICADQKILLLHQVKPEGKKSMDIASFVNGNREFLQ